MKSGLCKKAVEPMYFQFSLTSSFSHQPIVSLKVLYFNPHAALLLVLCHVNSRSVHAFPQLIVRLEMKKDNLGDIYTQQRS